MIVMLTGPQLHIIQRAKLYFDNALPDAEVRSMFRKSGRDLSVGLSYSEQGQHFIVRTIVPEDASDYTIDDLCGRLVAELAVSYAKVTKREARWGS